MEKISLKGIFSLALVKKERYFGSHDGMRFRLCKEEDQLMATVFPEPYCWEATADELKKSKLFPLSDEGIDQAVEWLNAQYEEEYAGRGIS